MIYYIALGSNLGDRLQNLKNAKQHLLKIGALYKQSPVYRSKPWGNTRQESFYNAVIMLQSDLRPFRLLRKLKTIETQLGRSRSVHWGPRLIDLDLIDWDGPAIQSNVLNVPHPFIEERNFVLLPLFDVDEYFVLPSGKPVYKAVREQSFENDLIKITENW